MSGTLAGSFGYDVEGRRRSRTIGGATQRLLHQGDTVTQEQDATGTPTANLISAGTDQYLQRTDGAGTQRFLQDGVGSTLTMLNADNTIAAKAEYEPFGARTTNGSSPNQYWFTGRDDDGTGLLFYRARYYQPDWGRFISEDPLGWSQGPNPYVYVGNDPVSFADSSGMILAGGTTKAVSQVREGDRATAPTPPPGRSRFGP